MNNEPAVERCEEYVKEKALALAFRELVRPFVRHKNDNESVDANASDVLDVHARMLGLLMRQCEGFRAPPGNLASLVFAVRTLDAFRDIICAQAGITIDEAVELARKVNTALDAFSDAVDGKAAPGGEQPS